MATDRRRRLALLFAMAAAVWHSQHRNNGPAFIMHEAPRHKVLSAHADLSPSSTSCTFENRWLLHAPQIPCRPLTPPCSRWPSTPVAPQRKLTRDHIRALAWKGNLDATEITPPASDMGADLSESGRRERKLADDTARERVDTGDRRA